MPSPFPGMDPYLEAPDIWPDFHDAFAGEIRAILNQSLPAPYYARLEMRPEVGIVEEHFTSRRIIPDVAVVRKPAPHRDTGDVAVLEQPRTEISEFLEVDVSAAAIRHKYVEIRDPSRGHQLVTLIEIVSPSNKQSGPDRAAYERKQTEVLESNASLIEVDLLRHGQRLFADPEVAQFVANQTPSPDYLVLVNRAWRRTEGARAYQIFPAMITGPLPCIPVPLREGENEILLDLQFVFRRAYDSGPYRRGAVDYTSTPRPPLPADLAAWGDARVRAAGLR